MRHRLSLCALCIAAWIETVPAYGLDLHLQELPPAPGLRPSEPLDPLSGLQEAVNCGLDFLNTAQACGLSAPSETASPFLVRFDPLFCRLTMRFSIGELIDGLLKQWIAGAFARIDSPAIGALCLLGIGPQFCSGATTTPTPFEAAVRPGAVSSKAALPPTRAPQQRLDAIRRDAAQGGAAPSSPTPPAAGDPTPDTPSPERDAHERTGLDSLTR